MLVIDVSGSMADENRLENAKDGLSVFFDEVSPNDRLGLIAFSDKTEPLVPLGARFQQTEQKLRATVQGLVADGGTAVYDATAEGLSAVRGLDDATRINAVVVLTDGEDTDSVRSADQVVDFVSDQDDAAPRVRVFTIAYSADAEGAADSLERIARLGRPGLHRDRPTTSRRSTAASRASSRGRAASRCRAGARWRRGLRASGSEAGPAARTARRARAGGPSPRRR